MSKIISLTSIIANWNKENPHTGEYYLTQESIQVDRPIWGNWFDASNSYAPIHNGTDVVSIEEILDGDGDPSNFLVRTKDKHWFIFPTSKYIPEFINEIDSDE